MYSFKEQLTLRGVIIGSIGAVILTMSSMYVALKLGALPWPIIFVALASMFFLKICGKFGRKTNIQEINVTHTIMSAGAMTAGGIAFTIPGIYMLNPEATVGFSKLLIVVLGGVVLGLIFTALIRKYFIDTRELSYPMGQAAAKIIVVGDKASKKSIALFVSLIGAAAFTLLRDWFAKIPATIMSSKMAAYGSLSGIWLSPMLISVGYIIGPVFVGVWFLGGVFGDFGILLAGTKMNLWSIATAADIKTSLGIGLMVGTGAGIIIKGIIPKAKEIFLPMFKKEYMKDGIINLRWAPFVMALLAVVFTLFAGFGIIGSIITILGVWLTTTMAAQSVGQSGINPMEIFGIIILLAVKATSNIDNVSMFLVAGVVAVAAGLVGDVMNDFKAGKILKTNIKAQWIGEAIGGLIGAFVAVSVFYVLLTAYGPESFGNPEGFIAPQAGVVAAMVGGIPNITAFVIGLIIATILYCLNFPVMTLGLGVYLPFYLSATVFIGGAIKFITTKLNKKAKDSDTGLIIASGILGGEAVAGVVIALIQALPVLVSL